MLKKAITIILALTMMSGTSVFASNETEESNNATQIEQSSEVTAFESNISRAVSLGIINNENYTFNDDITREQFCNFVYNLVNPIKELPIFKYERAPFDDTNGNDKITVLYSAKIVSGKDDYIFSPNDKLTREEAATILCRAANYLDIELPLAKVDMSYADNYTKSQNILVYFIPILFSFLCYFYNFSLLAKNILTHCTKPCYS